MAQRGGGASNSGADTGEIDAVDRRLLALLLEDARLSIREIGRRLGMSAGAVAERVARLEARGIIAGYHAVIDPSKLGFGLEVIIGLQTLQGPALEPTLDRLLEIPEVEQVQVVTGQWDVIVRLRVRDHEHLRAVVLDEVWRMPAFRHSETLLVLETRQRPSDWNVALVQP